MAKKRTRDMEAATGTGGEDGHIGELFGREDLQKLVMDWLRALKRGKC